MASFSLALSLLSVARPVSHEFGTIDFAWLNSTTDRIVRGCQEHVVGGASNPLNARSGANATHVFTPDATHR